MELRQLRYFLAVADQLHFRRAADQLHVAQPSLSMQVKALEEELGVQLFERTSRNVRLTTSGAYFRLEARRIIQDLQMAQQAARKISEGLQGDICVGASIVTMISQFPAVMSRIREQYPNLRVDFQILGSTEVLSRLSMRAIDLGFVHPFEDAPNIETRTIWQHGFSLVIPEFKKFAVNMAELEHRNPSLAGLSGMPLIACEPTVNPHLHASVLQICGATGFVPSQIRYVPDIPSILALVACEFGVGFVPEHWASFAANGIRQVPLSGSELPTLPVAACWRTDDRRPLIDRLVTLISELVHEQREIR